MSTRDFSEEIMQRLRARNVLSHPHRWTLDVPRDVYVGEHPDLGEVAAQDVARVKEYRDL